MPWPRSGALSPMKTLEGPAPSGLRSLFIFLFNQNRFFDLISAEDNDPFGPGGMLMKIRIPFLILCIFKGSLLAITGLIFAFLIGEELAEGAQLRAGIAKVDITPAKPVMLGGYGLRTGPSSGVYGPVFVRALVFDDGSQRIVLIESDVVDYSQHLEIRKRVSAETGIPLPGVLLAAVHNHSAPDPSSSGTDPGWKKEFVDKIVIAAKQAIARLEPVRLGGNIGHSRLGMNRRKKVEAANSTTTFDENYFSQSFGKYKTDDPVKIREIYRRHPERSRSSGEVRSLP